MKNIHFLIGLMLIGSNLLAKDWVDGYTLLPNDDTVKCKIKVPKDLDLFDKVSVQDSLGMEQTYKSKNKEINGFGFFYKDQKYDYALIVDDRGGAQFLMRKLAGTRFNLYYRYDYMSFGSGASYRSDTYMLQDTAKRSVTVTGNAFSSYKKKIKAFLKDDPAMLDLFEKTVSGITDIEKFVKQANSL
jgi:hypothetical protein